MKATRTNHFTPSLSVGLLLTLGLLTACNSGTTKPPTSNTTKPPTSSSITTADSGVGSLRAALSTAASGATLKLASGTVSLASALKVSKSVTLDLGSAVLDAGGKGRVLEVPSGVTVTIKGGTLRGGVGAPITASSVGQQALTYGGVLINSGTLILDGTTVTGGKANDGGGIANVKGATLTLKGTTTVTGNTSDALPDTNPEQYFRYFGGGGIYNDGTLKLEGGAVNGNSAVYTGGGIFATKTSTITISSGSVNNNKCTHSWFIESRFTGGCGGGGIIPKAHSRFRAVRCAATSARRMVAAFSWLPSAPLLR